MAHKQEDEVRNEADLNLGFAAYKGNPNVQVGTGQITTFNSLGFPGVSDKPDGWFIPYDKTRPAFILECKKEDADIFTGKCIAEIKKNCRVLLDAGYEKVFGLLTNGKKSLGLMNNEPVDIPGEVQNIQWYLKRFEQKSIDKDYIYNLTKKINDCLHSEFGIKNLYHRMIFTACALVAKRYGADLSNSAKLGWAAFQGEIKRALNQAFIRAQNQNVKLDLLLEVFDRKFAAQAPCFSYGVSGAVAGFH